MHEPLTTSIILTHAWDGNEVGGGKIPPPTRISEETTTVLRKERGKMLSVGFFSGLVTQSEIDDLLDMLYGSYGERLVVSYKRAS
jgi:hypothetical protein